MSSRTMSARICGVGMFASCAFANLRLRNSADALQNPELEQARHSRNKLMHTNINAKATRKFQTRSFLSSFLRRTPKSQSADKGNECLSREKVTGFFTVDFADNDELVSVRAAGVLSSCDWSDFD